MERGAVNVLTIKDYYTSVTGFADPPTQATLLFHKADNTHLLQLDDAADGFDGANKVWKVSGADSATLPTPILTETIYYSLYVHDGTDYYRIQTGHVVLRDDPLTTPGGGSVPSTSGYALTVGDTFTGDVTMSGGNIVMAGAETVDGRDVSADGTTLDALGTTVGTPISVTAGVADAGKMIITDANGVIDESFIDAVTGVTAFPASPDDGDVVMLYNNGVSNGAYVYRTASGWIEL